MQKSKVKKKKEKKRKEKKSEPVAIIETIANKDDFVRTAWLHLKVASENNVRHWWTTTGLTNCIDYVSWGLFPWIIKDYIKIRRLFWGEPDETITWQLQPLFSTSK